MPTPDEIRSAVERYLKLSGDGDADGIAALYSEKCTLEDPIGAPVHEGKAAVHGFYKKVAGQVQLKLSGPIRACGNEAAYPMVATLGDPDDPSYLDIINVMTFDDEGKITSMRAFWNPESIRKN